MATTGDYLSSSRIAKAACATTKQAVGSLRAFVILEGLYGQDLPGYMHAGI